MEESLAIVPKASDICGVNHNASPVMYGNDPRYTPGGVLTVIEEGDHGDPHLPF
jgi:hypothetical protein